MRLRDNILILAAAVVLTLSGCDNGAKAREESERIAREQADSIARVEEQARLLRIEQERADSIERALLRAERFAADSAARAELLPAFKVTENVSDAGCTDYRIKGTPTGHYQNSAYLSFTTLDGRASELCMNFDYYGSDWLYMEKAVVIIDDNAYDVVPDRSETSDNVGNNLMCSEWFSSTDISQVISALDDAKSMTVRLVGKDRTKDLKISQRQLEGMKKTVKLYNLF